MWACVSKDCYLILRSEFFILNLSAMSFLRSFFSHPHEVGAVAPSGKSYSELTCRQVKWNQVAVLVEIGAGDGAVTKYIVSHMKPEQVLVVFEINDQLFAKLKKKFNQANVILIHDSAEHIEKYLKQYNLAQPDVIFSELPLVTLPVAITENILQAVKRTLKRGGIFLQLSYSLVGKKRLQAFFGQVKVRFTLFNIPPAFLYICQFVGN